MGKAIRWRDFTGFSGRNQAPWVKGMTHGEKARYSRQPPRGRLDEGLGPPNFDENIHASVKQQGEKFSPCRLEWL
jgi:hypothetical protein